jgi:hypothetical protein
VPKTIVSQSTVNPLCFTVMWRMNGFQVADQAIIAGDPNWQISGIGDFDGDGKHDILWYNPQSQFTVEWLMNGFQPISMAVLAADPNWTLAAPGRST